MATTVDKARQRAAALAEVTPPTETRLHLAATLLARGIGEIPPRVTRLALDMGSLLNARDGGGAKAYLGQLVQLVDIWQRLRQREWSWPVGRDRLVSLMPQVAGVLAQTDETVGLYALLGSLAELVDNLDHLAVLEGQARRDIEPEALAVGDAGLILGRFAGVWKLMAANTAADLHDVWSDGAVAYAVGDGGTLLELKQGRWRQLALSTNRPLYCVRPIGDAVVVVAGEAGTLAARDHDRWHLLASPTSATLRAAYGRVTHDILVGGDADQLWRYDGYAWNAIALPPGSRRISDIVAAGPRIAATGSVGRAGGLFWLTAPGAQLDPHLDVQAPLESAFVGWGGTLGMVTAEGEVLAETEGGWQRQRLRLHGAHAADWGNIGAVTGRHGRYSVIWEHRGERWEPHVSVEGLTLRGVWCAGEAKPPRLASPAADSPSVE